MPDLDAISGVTTGGRLSPGGVLPQDVARAFSAANAVDPGSEMPEAGLVPFHNKVATSEYSDEEVARNRHLLGGAAGLGVGAAVVDEAVPYVSGRQRLYHGTSSDMVDKIKREGIRPAARTGNKGITHQVLDKEIADMPLVYAANKKHLARFFAHQSDWLKNNPVPPGLGQFNWAMKRQMDLAAAPFVPHPGVLDISMPYDEFLAKERHNPELDTPAARADPAVHAELKNNAHAIHEGIDPEHIKGHAGYKGPTYREVVDYAKKHPKRFARGVGVGVAGLGVGALGVDQLRRAYNAHQEIKDDSKYAALGVAAALRDLGLSVKLAEGAGALPSPASIKPKPLAKVGPTFDTRTDKPEGYNLTHGVQTMSNGADVNDSYGAFGRRLQGSPV